MQYITFMHANAAGESTGEEWGRSLLAPSSPASSAATAP